MYFRIRNWSEYQHYKKKDPAWIKLYRSTLTDSDLMRLPVSTRWLAIGLLVLAAETNNEIPNDPDWITWRLRLEEAPDLSTLASVGFIEGYSGSRESLEKVYSDSIPETEKETEKETDSVVSQPGEPDVDNSLEEGLAWNARLAPLAREAGGERNVGNWLRKAKGNPAHYEMVLPGLVSLRDRGALDFVVKPGEPMSPGILDVTREGQPIERRAIAEYWRMNDRGRRDGSGLERIQA